MDATTPPERPPRPDEDLIRFHNGDTLDNIPIVQVQARRRWKDIAVAAAVLMVLGGCVTAIVTRSGSKMPGAAPTASVSEKPSAVGSLPASPSSTQPVQAAAPASPSCITVHFKAATGPVSCQPVSAICADGAPYFIPQIDELCGGFPTLQTVHLLSMPQVGGDPGANYCIAFTGSGSDTGRDGVLLMNTPHYQCSADILPDSQGRKFFSSVPSCQLDPGTRMVYPAVLDFRTVAPGTAPEFVCLMGNDGA
ncbi:hypothetical protein [Streptantibioticus ferralitis]|uniref:Uncharacterized protein n=1 Tax=Streptantibioticus ferralitis TaxID=236510 RepID=A0ABT5ZD42_9ACTN|nr:hypothetical protein [Streptantibioticus ferralitis]MDF2261557.1 hypothetical protein [Streptantibioticus ferralitis]